jgi:hypothetical protein
MSKGTAHRTVRVEDGLWDAAKAEAERRGDKLSQVIRRALELYANGQHRQAGDAVTVAAMSHIDNCPDCRARYA